MINKKFVGLWVVVIFITIALLIMPFKVNKKGNEVVEFRVPNHLVKVYYLNGDSIVCSSENVLYNTHYIELNEDSICTSIPYHSIEKFIKYK